MAAAMLLISQSAGVLANHRGTDSSTKIPLLELRPSKAIHDSLSVEIQSKEITD